MGKSNHPAWLGKAMATGGRAEGGRTPGEDMQDARKRRDDAESNRNHWAGNTAAGAALRAAQSGIPGKVGKALKGASSLITGAGLLGTGNAQGKKSSADAEMKRLGEGKATEGEEDRAKGGAVKRKARKS